MSQENEATVIPPGYKQTEVGVVPLDWHLIALGGVCKIQTGKKDVNEGNPDGQYPFFTCSRDHTYSDNHSFDTEAILIAGNGEVGNLHYFRGKFEAYQRTYVLSDFRVSVQLLWYQMDAYLRESLGIGTIGSSIPYIKKENLSNFKFALPPSPAEQRAIAEALSDVDKLLGSLEKLIAKKRAIKQAAMQQLLIGKTRLPDFSPVETRSWVRRTGVSYGYKQTEMGLIPEDWHIIDLGEVCRIRTGKKDVNEGNPDGQYPFFTCSQDHTYSDNYSFDTEAILIAGNGEVGNLHYFRGKFEAYQRTYVLSDFCVDAQLLWHQLSVYLRKSLGIGVIGSSIPYIKKENLFSFRLALPLSPTEQYAIATVLSDIDAEIATLERRLEKTRAIKQGMMQQLLTGRVRLVRPEPDGKS